MQNQPRKRAHRWNAVSVVAAAKIPNSSSNSIPCSTNSADSAAASASASSTQENNNINNNNQLESQKTTATATVLQNIVVFCPFAAKGSQNLSLTTTTAATETQEGEEEEEQKQQDEEQEQEQKDSSSSTNKEEESTTSESTTTTTKATRQQKRNRQDIVTATTLWLVDATVNRVIGRLEKIGLVAVLEKEILEIYPHIQTLHLAGQEAYKKYVLSEKQERLTQNQKQFFISEFVENVLAEKRKYGNPAVSNPMAVKCAHALSAQALAGILCPLGQIVVEFIIWLGEKISSSKTDDEKTTTSTISEDQSFTKEADKLFETHQKDWSSNLLELFRKFAIPTVLSWKNENKEQENEQEEEKEEEEEVQDATRLFNAAKTIVDVFATELGEGGGRRRKRRTD